MWIVRLALRRPYTFVVAALLVAILGILAILKMPTDIFPNIDIPVIAVAFNYDGMTADDMDKRITTPFERILTTVVNNIEHTEAQSLSGRGIIKIFFHQNANIEEATAQVTAISQTAIRQMPVGTQPPLIISYSASDVPVLQLSIGSKTLPEQELFDNTINNLRQSLITVPGAEIPYPYGGKQMVASVDLDPQKLSAYNISPADVSSAINAQNVILPAGMIKIGSQEYPVRLNSSPELLAALNDVPIKTVKGATILIRDIGNVRVGFLTQTSKVHANGHAGVLLSILKNGNASTLDVVAKIKAMLPQALLALPHDFHVTPMFDQSIFVRAAVEGVVKEAAMAAGLTGLMILLFLGSWRSTLIVVISIPLSILTSIIVLWLLGQTLNVMTLGGMALAVGILVDDATVEIENIHRNLHQKKRLVKAILDGAQQIAVPAFVSTLCICIVFVPVVFISGAAKYLFTPLAMAVVFAMMTSYLLSRTLVPTMVHYLLAPEVERYGGELDPDDPHAAEAIWEKQHHRHRHHHRRKRHIWIVLLIAAVLGGAAAYFRGWLLTHLHLTGVATYVHAWVVTHLHLLAMIGFAALGVVAVGILNSKLDLFWRIHDAFNVVFEKFRRIYGGFLNWSLSHRAFVVTGFCIFFAGSLLLAPFIGEDFFPQVDAGQLRMHVRTPPGTRIEESSRYFAMVENYIRSVIPKDEVANILDNIGIPNSTINTALSDGSLMSSADGEILVSLTEKHHPTAQYMKQMRRDLPVKFPQLICFFQPSDIATQVLNFGLPASIDVQVAGPARNLAKDEQLAKAMVDDLRKVPGAADVRLQQVSETPDLRVDVDRVLANQAGLAQKDVASDVLISLSSSGQTAPNFWFDSTRGVSYTVSVKTPDVHMDTLQALETTPISPQLLTNLASVGRGISPTDVTHYNVKPAFDVMMGVQGADLGSVANNVEKVVAKFQKLVPPGSTIQLRGQIDSMHSSFSALGTGLIFAVLLVYLLMVINFQSWIDPLIILMALPGALAGILWMLYASSTTISVPALMGAIMSIGVATANSILMITFANDQRKHGLNAHDAALNAGMTRLRPVIMTALAMIIGMLPMSLGLGEGGEQNAPLGRAVIGGLACATFSTLLFVPVVYSLLRRKAPQTKVEKELQ